MAYARRDLVGGAVATTLSGSISSGDTSFSISATTGWPSGSNGDFFVVLDRGTASEEKVRCSSRTSGTVTVASSGRGADGTSATSHASGAAAEVCLTALDLDEANYAVAQTVGKVTAAGDLIYASGANAFSKLAKGTSGYFLKQGASAPSWAGITSSDMSDFTSAVNALISAGSSSIGYVGSTTYTSTNPSSSSSTFADITGITCSFTAVSGKRYRVSVNLFVNTLTGGTAQYQLLDPSSNVIASAVFYPSGSGGHTVQLVGHFTAGSSGTLTTKLQWKTTSGATVTALCDSTHPGVLLVEQIS